MKLRIFYKKRSFNRLYSFRNPKNNSCKRFSRHQETKRCLKWGKRQLVWKDGLSSFWKDTTSANLKMRQGRVYFKSLKVISNKEWREYHCPKPWMDFQFRFDCAIN